MRLTLPLPDPLRRATNRHRRLIAAVLAALATLLAISAIRPAPSSTTAAESTAPTVTSTRPGEVTVPVMLDSPVLAGTVETGDEIDLVSIDAQGQAAVVAERARVVEQGVGSSPLGAASPVLLVAVPEETALDLAAASLTSRLSLLIHPPSGP